MGKLALNGAYMGAYKAVFFRGTEGSGTFTYDSDDITGSGYDNLNGDDDISLTLIVNGGTYYGYQDVDNASDGTGEYPEFSFDDGLLTGFDFILEDGANGVSLLGGLSELTLDGVESYTHGVYTINGTAVVPEPGTFGILCLGLMALGSVRRKSI